MGEQIAAGVDVSQAEMRPESAEAFARFLVALAPFVDLYEPVVVGITGIARDTISRNFLLEVNVGDWRTNVMRVKRFVSLDVAELDAHSRCDVRDVVVVPVGIGITVRGRVHDPPIVVIVSMRVERNLLF